MKKFSINNLSFKFAGSSHDFFRHVNLTFEPGFIHFIQGKNGVGKSTLFNILQGTIHDHQLSGSFDFDDTHYLIKNNRISTGFTNQIKTVVQQVDEMIADQFTVGQNLQLAALQQRPNLGQLPNQQKLPPILQSVGLRSDTPVHQLSGGQRQILAILMALQKPTRILLLDEPTAALDPKNAHMVMQSLQKLATERDLIVLAITHEKEIVETYAQNKYIEITMQDGGVRDIRTVLKGDL